MYGAQNESKRSSHKYTDKEISFNLTNKEYQSQQQGDASGNYIWITEMTYRDKSCLMSDHNAAFLQADKGQEQSNAHTDPMLKIVRDSFADPFVQCGKGNNRE
ncbi:hypothetical protein D3C85_1262650 [compost metagenome]